MSEETELLRRLRSGDEAAFADLVRKHHASLVGVAQTFVRNRATAEEVVQDTWVAVIEGLERFEGRSSLKNWVFAILANRARSRAVRDGRVVTAGDLSRDPDADRPAVDPASFDPSGRWLSQPSSWDELTPERLLAGSQLWAHVKGCDRQPAAGPEAGHHPAPG